MVARPIAVECAMEWNTNKHSCLNGVKLTLDYGRNRITRRIESASANRIHMAACESNYQ